MLNSSALFLENTPFQHVPQRNVRCLEAGRRRHADYACARVSVLSQLSPVGRYLRQAFSSLAHLYDSLSQSLGGSWEGDVVLSPGLRALEKESTDMGMSHVLCTGCCERRFFIF